MRILSRVVLVGVLCASAVAKLMSPHQDFMLLSVESYYLVALGEILLAIGLLSRWSHYFARGALAAALAGSVLFWWQGGWGRCGCFGSWELGAKFHIALLAVVGLCSVCLAGQAVRSAKGEPLS